MAVFTFSERAPWIVVTFHSVSGTTLASVILLAYGQAHALSISDLTDGEASLGLKTALERARWPPSRSSVARVVS